MADGSMRNIWDVLNDVNVEQKIPVTTADHVNFKHNDDVTTADEVSTEDDAVGCSDGRPQHIDKKHEVETAGGADTSKETKLKSRAIPSLDSMRNRLKLQFPKFMKEEQQVKVEKTPSPTKRKKARRVFTEKSRKRRQPKDKDGDRLLSTKQKNNTNHQRTDAGEDGHDVCASSMQAQSAGDDKVKVKVAVEQPAPVQTKLDIVKQKHISPVFVLSGKSNAENRVKVREAVEQHESVQTEVEDVKQKHISQVFVLSGESNAENVGTTEIDRRRSPRKISPKKTSPKKTIPKMTIQDADPDQQTLPDDSEQTLPTDSGPRESCDSEPATTTNTDTKIITTPTKSTPKKRPSSKTIKKLAKTPETDNEGCGDRKLTLKLSRCIAKIIDGHKEENVDQSTSEIGDKQEATVLQTQEDKLEEKRAKWRILKRQQRERDRIQRDNSSRKAGEETTIAVTDRVPDNAEGTNVSQELKITENIKDKFTDKYDSQTLVSRVTHEEEEIDSETVSQNNLKRICQNDLKTKESDNGQLKPSIQQNHSDEKAETVLKETVPVDSQKLISDIDAPVYSASCGDNDIGTTNPVMCSCTDVEQCSDDNQIKDLIVIDSTDSMDETENNNIKRSELDNHSMCECDDEKCVKDVVDSEMDNAQSSRIMPLSQPSNCVGMPDVVPQSDFTMSDAVGRCSPVLSSRGSEPRLYNLQSKKHETNPAHWASCIRSSQSQPSLVSQSNDAPLDLSKKDVADVQIDLTSDIVTDKVQPILSSSLSSVLSDDRPLDLTMRKTNHTDAHQDRCSTPPQSQNDCENSRNNIFKSFSLHGRPSRKISPVRPHIRGKPVNFEDCSHMQTPTHNVQTLLTSHAVKITDTPSQDYTVFSVKRRFAEVLNEKTSASNTNNSDGAMSLSGKLPHSFRISGGVITNISPTPGSTITTMASSPGTSSCSVTSSGTVLNVPNYNAKVHTLDSASSRSGRTIPTAHVKPNAFEENLPEKLKRTARKSTTKRGAKLMREKLQEAPKLDSLTLAPIPTHENCHDDGNLMPVLSPHRDVPHDLSRLVKSDSSVDITPPPPALVRQHPSHAPTDNIIEILSDDEDVIHNSKDVRIKQLGNDLRIPELESTDICLNRPDDDAAVVINQPSLFISKSLSPTDRSTAATSITDSSVRTSTSTHLSAFLAPNIEYDGHGSSFSEHIAFNYNPPNVKKYRMDIAQTRYYSSMFGGKNNNSLNIHNAFEASIQNKSKQNALKSAFPNIELTDDWKQDFVKYQLDQLRIPKKLVQIPKKIPVNFMTNIDKLRIPSKKKLGLKRSNSSPRSAQDDHIVEEPERKKKRKNAKSLLSGLDLTSLNSETSEEFKEVEKYNIVLESITKQDALKAVEALLPPVTSTQPMSIKPEPIDTGYENCQNSSNAVSDENALDDNKESIKLVQEPVKRRKRRRRKIVLEDRKTVSTEDLSLTPVSSVKGPLLSPRKVSLRNITSTPVCTAVQPLISNSSPIMCPGNTLEQKSPNDSTNMSSELLTRKSSRNSKSPRRFSEDGWVYPGQNLKRINGLPFSFSDISCVSDPENKVSNSKTLHSSKSDSNASLCCHSNTSQDSSSSENKIQPITDNPSPKRSPNIQSNHGSRRSTDVNESNRSPKTSNKSKKSPDPSRESRRSPRKSPESKTSPKRCLDFRKSPLRPKQSPVKCWMHNSNSSTSSSKHSSSASGHGESPCSRFSKKKRSILDELANTDGYVAEKRLEKANESLLLDPSQLSREERALQRAMMKFSEMEQFPSSRSRKVSDCERKVPTSPTQSSSQKKAGQLKRRAIKGHKATALGGSLKQRFDDFKPVVLLSRTRLQATALAISRKDNGPDGQPLDIYDKMVVSEPSNTEPEKQLGTLARPISPQVAYLSEDDTLPDIPCVPPPSDVTDEVAPTSPVRAGGDAKAETEPPAKKPKLQEQERRGSMSEHRGKNLGKGSGRGRSQSKANRPHSGSRGRGGKRSWSIPRAKQGRVLSAREAIFEAPRIEVDMTVDPVLAGIYVSPGNMSLSPHSVHRSQFSSGPQDSPFSRGDDDTMSLCSSTHGDFPRHLVPPEVKRLQACKDTGETILHKAARNDHYDVVLWCCRTHYVDVNARDHAGFAALHETCVSENVDIARCLLEHGADVNVASRLDGVRPIHDAIERSNFELVRLFLAWGADPTLSTYSGRSPLKIARTEEMKDFIHSYLVDLNGTSQLERDMPWEVPFDIKVGEDTCTTGSDFFAGLPLDDEEELGTSSDIVFEASEQPFIPCFLVNLDAESRPRNCMLLCDLLARLQINEKEFQQKYRHIPLYTRDVTKLEGPEVFGLLKACERSINVDMILYDDKVKQILNVETTTIGDKDYSEMGSLRQPGTIDKGINFKGNRNEKVKCSTQIQNNSLSTSKTIHVDSIRVNQSQTNVETSNAHRKLLIDELLAVQVESDSMYSEHEEIMDSDRSTIPAEDDDAMNSLSPKESKMEVIQEDVAREREESVITPYSEDNFPYADCKGCSSPEVEYDDDEDFDLPFQSVDVQVKLDSQEVPIQSGSQDSGIMSGPNSQETGAEANCQESSITAGSNTSRAGPDILVSLLSGKAMVKHAMPQTSEDSTRGPRSNKSASTGFPSRSTPRPSGIPKPLFIVSSDPSPVILTTMAHSSSSRPRGPPQPKMYLWPGSESPLAVSSEPEPEAEASSGEDCGLRIAQVCSLSANDAQNVFGSDVKML